MNTQKHYLYIIRNLLNNKIYIGQTINPKKRWCAHKTTSKKPIQYISKAMAKYGINNFTFEIIAECLSQNDTDKVEVDLIKQYDSCNKYIGYNIKSGGIVSTGWHHTNETKIKISKSEKGKIISAESKLKMSNSKKVRPCSTETRLKQSETKKKNKLLKFNDIIIAAIKNEYNSGDTMSVLSKKYKTRRSTISKIINDKSFI